MLQEGALKVTGAEWPSFLYNETLYDPEEPDKGLLHGYLLVRVRHVVCAMSMTYNIHLQVFQHIFTGPASAMSAGDCKSTKPLKAKIHGLTKPTP